MEYQQQHQTEWARPRPLSEHVQRRAVELWATGYLSRISWAEEPGWNDRHGVMTAPSGSRGDVRHRVEYDAEADTFACSCEAGRNGNHCPHGLLCGVWLGVRSLPSYVEGPYRVIGVPPRGARL